MDEFETALAAVLKGPLPPAALQSVAELTAGFSGESRRSNRPARASKP